MSGPGRAGQHQYREAVRAVLDDDHPDARLVFATLTGYGYITRWRLDGDVSSIAKDPACPNFREMAPSGGSAASSAPTERHVAVAKRRLSVPELRERLETGGLRRPAGWFARRDHQREYSVQQPTGLGGILIRAGYAQLGLCLQALQQRAQA